MDKHTNKQASKLINFTRFTWTPRIAGGSIHSPRLQESWSYNLKLFQTFCVQAPQLPPVPLPHLKGLPNVSLLDFSPLLSKLNYTLPFLLLTLLFQWNKDRSLPDLFLYLCPWHTPSLPFLPTAACLALSSFLPAISAAFLTSYQSVQMLKTSCF